MLIDATHAEETRVVVVDGNKVEEFDFESENKRQLAGNIYLAKVTRVEPSLQAAFVDYGGNRHGFLAFSEIHPDYYQIPVADREALMAEERAYAEAMRAREDEESTRQRPAKAQSAANRDAVERSDDIAGMETIDLSDEADEDQDDTAVSDVPEGTSPMERVAETPVEEPEEDTAEAEDTPEESEDASDDSADVASESDDENDDAAEPDDEDGDTDETDDADGENGSKGSSSRRSRSSRSRSSRGRRSRAADKDDSIEAVADDDDQDDIRPPRKPRPRRYKIQEVIHVRQILLVQVVKEERGNKGAALTTYLSLAGRYCVLMPNTARGGGISRKITNAADRKKLKEIATEIDVPTGAGLIVRTAGAKRTKAEIKRDYEYLQRLWEQIRELTLKSIAPAKIYEEGDLIKRSIRDLYNRDIDEVLVEGERGYRIAKDFMKMIMPSHAKNVKNYQDGLPLFARYQVESYLAGMFNPTVQLKSGGYIVIGVTEALVAIDVNSGRATKEGSIEETALKTNLEAAEEVARQLRLRDLAGLIVIDFIDMDERKNNAAVEKRIKDKLKTDRARIQVGRISGFGLMEMSRQRLRPGMIEATTAPCPHCHGTGLIRSDDNLALQVLRQIEEEGVRRRCREVVVRCPVGIANFLMNSKREHIAMIEARYGLSVRVEGDPSLVSPDFSIEKLKTATRRVPEVEAPVVSADTSLMSLVDEDAETEAEEEAETPELAEDEETPKPKKRRRRRRRRGGKSKSQDGDENGSTEENSDQEGEAAKDAKPESDDSPAEETNADEAKPEDGEDEAKPAKKKRTRSRSRSKSKKTDDVSEMEANAPAKEDAAPVDAPAEAEAEKAEPVSEDTGTSEADEPTSEPLAEEASAEPGAAPEPEPVVEAETASEPEVEAEPVAETPAEPEAEAPAEPEVEQPADPVAEETAKEPEPVAAEAVPEPAAAEPPKPKRRGWWSMGG